MILKLKKFILQEKFFLIFMLSFVFFWLRGVNCEISLYNIGKLALGLVINLPLFFLVSSNLRPLLKKFFGSKYKYLKLCLYIIFVSFFYSIFLTEEHISFARDSYSNTLFLLTAFHVWAPLFLLIPGYLLIEKNKGSGPTIQTIIFIMGICIFSKVSSILIFKYFNFFKHLIYNISLIRVYFNSRLDTFNLYQFWWLYFALLMIGLSAISFRSIGFNKKWDKKTIIYTIVFACYIILPHTLNFDVNYRLAMTQKFAWNVISSLYFSISVPFIEETLFRGIIQTYFCTKLNRIKDGSMVAILITSLLFTLFHYPFIGGSFSTLFIHGIAYG
jgi:membrane protease YdiL (CAAX protease family)